MAVNETQQRAHLEDLIHTIIESGVSPEDMFHGRHERHDDYRRIRADDLADKCVVSWIAEVAQEVFVNARFCQRIILDDLDNDGGW